MKTQEAILNGEKIDVVTDIDDDLIETNFFDNDDEIFLEDTTDLSKTIEIVKDELNEW